MKDQPAEGVEVDPVAFLRAMLKISPEDAAKAREDAAEVVRKERHEDDQPPYNRPVIS